VNALSELILTNLREVDDNLIISHAQDISGVINANIETQKYTDEIWGGRHTIKPAATLDMATFLELQKHGIMDDPQLFFQWLERNPEYKVVKKTFARNLQTF
jgi:hypothetical protein